MYNLFTFSWRFKQKIQMIMQFDWILSVLEQKQLENHEIYYMEAAE